MKKTHLLLFIIVIFAAGCASLAPEKPPPVHTPTEKEAFTINMDVSRVENRIQILEELKKSKDLSQSDQNVIMSLLAGYRLLKKTALDPVTGEECDALAQSLLQSLSLVENTYFREAGKVSVETDSFTDYAHSKNEILDLFINKDYKGVIQRTLAFRTRFPGGLTPRIGMAFAFSLAEDGMLEEAVEVASEIANKMEMSPDSVQLRREIAEWQLTMGETAAAEKTLEAISGIQDDRAAIVFELRKLIQDTPRKPSQPLHSMFQPSEGAAPLEIAPQMAPLQEKVDALVRAHDFAQARQLLLQEKAEREEGPETELMDRALKNIEESETAHEESVKAKEARQRETFETAQRLYEEEDYKGALKTLEQLERTQGLSPPAMDLKNRALESLINRERNRAAEIFLEAKKSKDPKKKRELFETACDILKTLVEEYPESPLKPKLMSHIKIVQREIEKLPDSGGER